MTAQRRGRTGLRLSRCLQGNKVKYPLYGLSIDKSAELPRLYFSNSYPVNAPTWIYFEAALENRTLICREFGDYCK